MSRATIYDVSQRAGVSIATVSRVLNSPDRVIAETRERVLVAIDELGFVPKFEALARARKHMGRISILSPFSTADSVVDRLRGVIAALSGLPYEVVIHDVNSAAQRDGYLANLALTHAVDGLIVIALPFDDAMARRLLKHRVATVQIIPSGQVFCPEITSILHDDTAGGRIAAEHLLAQGHRCLGYIGDAEGPAFIGVNRDQKLDSFRQTLAKAGVALPDTYIGLIPYNHTPMEEARLMAHRLLDLPHAPTAIFTGSDTQAIGVISAARERGLVVPADLAVMGFDDIEVAAFIGLTTIRQQLIESGRLAAELLLAQLNENPLPPQQIELPFTLMPRTTA